MGRQPCCDKVGMKKGPWTAEEDKKLINFILTNGQCCWRAVPKLAGLMRCGKSCRLRWTNYLRPDLKRGLLSEHEEKIVIDLHAQLGNRWSKIASNLPGRTDNEIKNHWNTHIKKKLRKMGIDPLNHKPLVLPTNDVVPQEPQQHSTILDEQDHQKETESSSSSSSKEEDDKIVTVEILDEFCIDEVPLIEPHEILGPTSSSSTSSSTSCDHGTGSFNMLDDQFQLANFDWQQLFDYTDINMDYFSGLDLVIDDVSNSLLDPPPPPPPLDHYPLLVLDPSQQDSWKFELF